MQCGWAFVRFSVRCQAQRKGASENEASLLSPILVLHDQIPKVNLCHPSQPNLQYWFETVLIHSHWPSQNSLLASTVLTNLLISSFSGKWICSSATRQNCDADCSTTSGWTRMCGIRRKWSIPTNDPIACWGAERFVGFNRYNVYTPLITCGSNVITNCRVVSHKNSNNDCLALF